MSRQNKVNPGMYTQRGRLTQDDAAREIAKQRAVGTQHAGQPVQGDRMPNLAAEPEPDQVENDEQAAGPVKGVEKSPARLKAAKPAARKAAKTASKKTAPAKKVMRAGKPGKAKSAKPVKAARAKAKSAKRRKS